MIGVSWSEQFFAFLISFGFGVLGGIVALLFFRKSRPVERVLVDFISCVAIVALYICSIEVGNTGCIAVFSIVAYALGVLVLPFSFKKIKKFNTKKAKKLFSKDNFRLGRSKK